MGIRRRPRRQRKEKAVLVSVATDAASTSAPTTASTLKSTAKHTKRAGGEEDPDEEVFHLTASGKAEHSTDRLGHSLSWFGVLYYLVLLALIGCAIWYYMNVVVPRRSPDSWWSPGEPGANNEPYISPANQKRVDTALLWLPLVLGIIIALVLGMLARGAWGHFRRNRQPPPPEKKAPPVSTQTTTPLDLTAGGFLPKAKITLDSSKARIIGAEAYAPATLHSVKIWVKTQGQNLRDGFHDALSKQDFSTKKEATEWLRTRSDVIIE